MNQPFAYKAGQFINLTLVIDGKAVSRSYSLSSAPTIDKQPFITVKKIDGGLMSEYILSNAEKINEWAVEGPVGLFYPSDDVLLSEHMVMVAGGSGITPIYSMIKFLLHHTSSTLTLVYSTRNWEQTIFRDQLLELETKFVNRFKIHFFVTGTDPHEPLNRTSVLKGRLSRIVFKKIIKQPSSHVFRTCYFLCGPEGLIKKAEEALGDLNTDRQSIFKEYFTPTNTSKQIPYSEQTFEVLFHFREQSNLLEVTPHKTILESAIDDSIPISYSCKSGTCGMCTAKLMKGKVHMERNFVLNETQLREGLILLCQSHPLDNDVIVEMA
ncbi:MAG TPA: iron-sulfur cluster-binding domain-containing protein [Flavisolibacter sp.]|nr:iron-sulfur cluster-binding domain-containing protein [Flavisolibacter sp.]